MSSAVRHPRPSSPPLSGPVAPSELCRRPPKNKEKFSSQAKLLKTKGSRLLGRRQTLCLAKTLLGFGIKSLWAIAPFLFLGYIRAMFAFIRLCLDTIGRLFRGRRSLLLENLALRQQLAIFKRRHPRPGLTVLDRLSWVTVRHMCSDWKNSSASITPNAHSIGAREHDVVSPSAEPFSNTFF
jgi:hypothetical protein